MKNKTKGYKILPQFENNNFHKNMLENPYGELPQSIKNALDNMVPKFCIKDEESDLTPKEVNAKMIDNINNLLKPDYDFLVSKFESIIISVNEDREYKEPEIDKEFLSLLIKIFY